MASIQELGLSNDQVGGDVDFDNLPKQGSYAPMLQPAKYRFRLPANLATVFDKIAANDKRGERLNVVFDQDHPLTIVQAPDKFKDRIGEPYQTRISNVERARGKDKILVSDLDYLLKALGHKDKPKTNVDYAKALMQYGGKEFDATVEVSFFCNPKNDKYVDDGQGGTTKLEGQGGCGARFYQNDVKDLKNADGTYPERITCSGNDGACSASLRGFTNLASFG